MIETLGDIEYYTILSTLTYYILYVFEFTNCINIPYRNDIFINYVIKTINL